MYTLCIQHIYLCSCFMQSDHLPLNPEKETTNKTMKKKQTKPKNKQPAPKRKRKTQEVCVCCVYDCIQDSD